MAVIEVDRVRPALRPRGSLAWAIAAYAIGALVVSPHDFGDLLLDYGQQAMVLPPFILLGACIAALIRRPRQPLSFLGDVLREHAWRFVAVMVAFCVGLTAFTTYKLAIPRFVPFYADPILADLDAALHHGMPYRFAHAILPAWAHYPLGWFYGPVWFFDWFGLMGFVALYPDKSLRTRYYWAMALLVCSIGTVLATLLSSVGPIFYDRIYESTRFADFDRLMAASPMGPYLRVEADYLYDTYIHVGDAMGSGISAMPSMHVAVATLNAWMLTSISRRIGVLAWLYCAIIMFGAVFLGWHYAIGTYVAFAVVSLIWLASGRILRRTEGAADAEDTAGNECPRFVRSA
jgi:hypothetical protein